MKRSGDGDEILDECLDRLARGETVAECADRYPERKDELVPLLQVAAATMQVASSVSYRPEARARGLNRLTGAVARMDEPRPRRFPWLAWPAPAARPLASGLVIALFATGAVVGTGMASSDSVPGDLLYTVKTMREDISLMMPKSNMSKAREHVRLAGVRGEEIGHLVDNGTLAEVELVANRMTRHLNESAVFVGINISTNPMEMPHRPVEPSRRQEAVELVAYLQHHGDNLKAIFESHLRSLPPEDRRLILQIMRRSELRYRTLIAAFEGSGPPRWAFWMIEPARPRGR